MATAGGSPKGKHERRSLALAASDLSGRTRIAGAEKRLARPEPAAQGMALDCWTSPVGM